MNVQELIEFLQKFEDKSFPVVTENGGILEEVSSSSTFKATYLTPTGVNRVGKVVVL
mgnify:CR=1 FL=1